MIPRGVTAGNFSVGMNSLPFLQGREEDSGGASGHRRRHSSSLCDGKVCHIRVKGVDSAEGTRSCLVHTCHTRSRHHVTVCPYLKDGTEVCAPELRTSRGGTLPSPRGTPW